MDLMHRITTITYTAESTNMINLLVFLAHQAQVIYWEIKRDSLLEGHILSMSSLPPAENHILRGNLPHPQKIEANQSQTLLQRKLVSEDGTHATIVYKFAICKVN